MTIIYHFILRINAHAGLVAKWGYLSGTLILLLKNMVWLLVHDGHLAMEDLMRWDCVFDILGASFFIGSAFCYGIAARDARFWRVAGYFVVAGTIMVMISGWSGHAGDAVFLLHALSMTPTMWAGICLILGRNAVGAVPEFLSRFPHAWAGVMQGDPGQVAFALVSAIGDFAIFCSDPRVKVHIMKKMGRTT